MTNLFLSLFLLPITAFANGGAEIYNCCKNEFSLNAVRSCSDTTYDFRLTVKNGSLSRVLTEGESASVEIDPARKYEPSAIYQFVATFRTSPYARQMKVVDVSGRNLSSLDEEYPFLAFQKMNAGSMAIVLDVGGNRYDCRLPN